MEGKEPIFHGWGLIEYSDGHSYEGDFRYGVRSGIGKLTVDQYTYSLGNWSDDKLNGLAYSVAPIPDYDKDYFNKYFGYWKDNNKHGFIIQQKANAKLPWYASAYNFIDSGIFENDIKIGCHEVIGRNYTRRQLSKGLQKIDTSYLNYRNY